MFRLDLHLNDSRPERFPEDGPYVFDPEAEDEKSVVGTAASELLQGDHAAFTLTAAGYTLADPTEGYNDFVLALVDLTWAARELVGMLASESDGQVDYWVYEQGIDLRFNFFKVDQTLAVTVIDQFGDLILDAGLRAAHPTEMLPAQQLLVEVRQVCQAVIDGGTLIGSDGLGEPVVRDWCLVIGIRPPGVG